MNSISIPVSSLISLFVAIENVSPNLCLPPGKDQKPFIGSFSLCIKYIYREVSIYEGPAKAFNGGLLKRMQETAVLMILFVDLAEAIETFLLLE
jgi:hypothetical protein